jgi:FlaG/FlaF family flagellin (archaellin)
MTAFASRGMRTLVISIAFIALLAVAAMAQATDGAFINDFTNMINANIDAAPQQLKDMIKDSALNVKIEGKPDFYVTLTGVKITDAQLGQKEGARTIKVTAAAYDALISGKSDILKEFKNGGVSIQGSNIIDTIILAIGQFLLRLFG